MNFKLLITALLLTSSCSLFSLESDAETKAEIINRLQKWPQDFNEKNIQAVCTLFAPDLIASYPESPDRNYEEMCQHLTKALNDSDKLFRYEAPKIEQILINGDLAVVRLIWTLNISDKNQQLMETIREKGLDVFKRQQDGSWKIIISYAFPEKR